MIVIDDDLWSAIGDPTRRRMLDQLLLDGGGTGTSLSEHLPVTRQAVAKHLDVLDRALGGNVDHPTAHFGSSARRYPGRRWPRRRAAPARYS